MSGFIAVHVGAGHHSEKKKPLYKNLCKKACKRAINLLKQNFSSLEAVAEAVSVLEDSPLTNAGIGSNLNRHGNIECDAGIMDGNTLHFGSVGSLCNIKNPIKVAKQILQEQNNQSPNGLIPPCTLVGKGATEWAFNKGFTFIDQNKLITSSTQKNYLKYLSFLKSEKLTEQNNSVSGNKLLDTVGAVCIDMNRNVSTAVSSGGINLKLPGRIGQAAVYGSGCWAQNASSSEELSIGLTVTGIGEYLIKTLFAKECYQMIYENKNTMSILSDAFKSKFMESPFLKNYEKKYAGILTVKFYPLENYCELGWGHSTESMIIGYMCVRDEKPKSIVSTLPESGLSGKSIIINEKCINFYNDQL